MPATHESRFEPSPAKSCAGILHFAGIESSVDVVYALVTTRAERRQAR